MSEVPQRRRGDGDHEEPESRTGGINLWVAYGVILLGLLVAIGAALLIVLPFYQHRR